MSPHHTRRSTDRPTRGWRLFLWHAERVWQDVVPLIALVLAAIAVFGNQSDLERQKEGRGIAINVLCSVSNGTVDAGRLILTDKLPGTEPYRQPRSAAQRKAADAYAKSYGRVISEAVVAQAGVRADDVIRKDGTVDCDALKRAALAVPDSQPSPGR